LVVCFIKNCSHSGHLVHVSCFACQDSTKKVRVAFDSDLAGPRYL
jgi:hypothetical protein